jgi:hypothetical protein
VLVFCLFIGISRVFGHFKHRENWKRTILE